VRRIFLDGKLLFACCNFPHLDLAGKDAHRASQRCVTDYTSLVKPANTCCQCLAVRAECKIEYFAARLPYASWFNVFGRNAVAFREAAAQQEHEGNYTGVRGVSY